MKAASTVEFGLISPLELIETSRPEPGARDVLVKVVATSVNPKDWKLNQPFSSLIPSLGPWAKPVIMGDDLAGVVVAKGQEVKGIGIGDAVYGMDMRLRTAACAEFARIDARCVALKPKTLNFAEAAATPLAGLTALQGLRIAQVGPGTKVLIIGASGGVGTFAVQIAKAMGAMVTGVCSTANVALVKKLGADEVIDYRQEAFTDRQDDFDVVFDVTSYQSLASCWGLLKDGGVFVSTGGNATAIIGAMRDRILCQQKKSKSVWVSPNRQDLEQLAAYIDQGLVRPVIDSQYAFEKVNDAYVRSKSGRSVGKVVVLVSDREA